IRVTIDGKSAFLCHIWLPRHVPLQDPEKRWRASHFHARDIAGVAAPPGAQAEIAMRISNFIELARPVSDALFSRFAGGATTSGRARRKVRHGSFMGCT